MPGDILHRNVALLIRGEPYPVEENVLRQGITVHDGSAAVDLAALYEYELRSSSPTAAYESAAVMRFQSGRHLRVSYSDRLNLRDTDFTVEGRAKIDAGATGSLALIDFRGASASASDSWAVEVDATSRAVTVFDGAATTHATGSNSLPVHGTWFHWAVVRAAGTVTVFIDGVPRASAVANLPATHTSGVRIGRGHDLTSAFLGRMDDLRITRAARYLASVPAVPLPDSGDGFSNVSLLLHCEGADGAATFTDSSSFGHAVSAGGNARTAVAQKRAGNSAAYFDGAGDYLQIADAGSFDFPGDFAVEMWVYPTSGGATRGLVHHRVADTSGSGTWGLSINAANALAFGNWQTVVVTTGGVVPQNTWSHVAVTRSSGAMALFVNGMTVASWADSTNFTNSNPLYLGFERGNGGTTPGFFTDFFAGYIDEVRITKDLARYVSTFTPPASIPNAPQGDPLYLDVGLLLQTSGSSFADRSTAGAAVTGAIFDPADSLLRRNAKPLRMRSGDPVVVVTSNTAQDLTGDFTIEFWLKLTSGDPSADDLVSRKTGAAAGGWWVTASSNGLGVRRITFQTAGGLTMESSDVNALANLGGWLHVAVVRSGSALNLRVNGKSVVSGTSTEALTGAHDVRVGPGQFYMHDLRLTRRAARYTSATYDMVPAAEADPFLDVTLFMASGGAPATTFGAATGINQQRPVGFASTEFGAPVATLSYSVAATGFSSTALGGPSSAVVLRATSLAPATALGEPRMARSVQVTGAAAATVFGLPAADLTSRASVPGKASSLEFGEPYVVVGLNLGSQRRAAGWGPVASFGASAAAFTFRGAATGTASTILPAPRLRLGLPALAGVAPTVAFGAASAGRASSTPGISSTAFGSPAARVAGLLTGLARTALGVPRARPKVSCLASGIAGTAFGAPTRPVALRLRSAVFRTGFGLAQVERP